MNKEKLPPAKRLSVLAMQFRGTKDKTERASIAREYSQAVDELIAGKRWRLIPPLEDQLPDDWMPETFFKHWSLGHPPQRERRSG